MELPFLRFEHGETIAMLRSTVQQFARAEVAPHAAELDATNQFPPVLQLLSFSFTGDFTGSFFVGVTDGDKLRETLLRQRRVNAGMLAPKTANTNYCGM